MLKVHKKLVIRSRACPTALVRSALESPDPGASNGGSNVELRHFGADMAASKVVGSPRISNISTQIAWPKFEILGDPTALEVAMSAPKCRNSTFEAPLDAPEAGLPSALQISAVRLLQGVRHMILSKTFKNPHLRHLFEFSVLRC